MQVILLERVAKLGQMGEVVRVKDGFARNFLLPQGKALRASDANIAAFEARKADLAVRNDETRAEAQKQAEKIDGQIFVIIRSASDAGAASCAVPWWGRWVFMLVLPRMCRWPLLTTY